MKARAILAVAAIALAGAACSAADAEPDSAADRHFETAIRPHLQTGCVAWDNLMDVLDNGPDTSGTARRSVELNDTVKEAFTAMAAADPETVYLAVAAGVFNDPASFSPEAGRVAYQALEDFCAGFRN